MDLDAVDHLGRARPLLVARADDRNDVTGLMKGACFLPGAAVEGDRQILQNEENTPRPGLALLPGGTTASWTEAR
jgi:hypothetical protein